MRRTFFWPKRFFTFGSFGFLQKFPVFAEVFDNLSKLQSTCWDSCFEDFFSEDSKFSIFLGRWAGIFCILKYFSISFALTASCMNRVTICGGVSASFENIHKCWVTFGLPPDICLKVFVVCSHFMRRKILCESSSILILMDCHWEKFEHFGKFFDSNIKAAFYVLRVFLWERKLFIFRRFFTSVFFSFWVAIFWFLGWISDIVVKTVFCFSKLTICWKKMSSSKKIRSL